MAMLPLATCARMLGIHPKTLHHWLTQANVPIALHPTDARIKCVAEEHLLEVARRHERPLPDLAEAPAAPEEQARALSRNEAQPAALPASSPSEADLIQKLSSLESKMATLQEQLAQLALALLQEREQHHAQQMTSLESFLLSSQEPGMLQQGDRPGTAPGAPLRQGRPLHPADQRVRSRLTALVEYSSSLGRYVLLSPQEGELAITPDSPQWFDWLASLTSFRFVGKAGRFAVYREYRERGQTRCWSAVRYFHHRTHKHYLGVTDHLTIDYLEQAAATLLARFPSL